ncbi:RNA/RNP complex-1-interacting phosphatase [Hippocampus comes]|uniref:RNA/RNP complex-1-interacting phosphatase n=1 Tax=Hippocampus comes TaxID=109280 RepID=UPI00094ED1FD|nr:PREDICTED: RNA/RNP complex-1-interacting phosphatase [Hippocampus comes]
MPRYGRKNSIPDRWLDYKAVGKRLGGTRFVAFKVPLKQSLNRGLEPAQVFGPWELLDAMQEDQQELGLVIDLTFTTRYYGPQDLPTSLRCVKIPTEGHVVPADGPVLAFKQAVRQFLRDNVHNDKLIGVHCTHGLNRTGYMICRYLIDVDEMDPAKAIKLFNSSRGHNMERSNYIDDLRTGPRRSNEGIDNRPPTSAPGQAVNRTPAAGRAAAGSAPSGGRWGGGSHTCRFFSPRATRQQPLESPQNDSPRFFPKGGNSRPPYECSQYERPQHESAQHYRPPRSSLLPFPPAHPASIPSRRAFPHAANWQGGPTYLQGHAQPTCVWGRPPPTALPRYCPQWANQQSTEDEGWG